MKKTLIGFLFLTGAVEFVLPIIAATHKYAFRPVFARAFDISKFTEEQKQVYRQFGNTDLRDWDVVFYCGIATIIIAILFLVIDSKRKPDA